MALLASPAENEVPAGLINSTTGYDGNAVFTLAHLPQDPTRIKLYVAGVRQTLGLHFTVGGQSIVFSPGFVPLAGDIVLADYPWIPTPVAAPVAAAAAVAGVIVQDTVHVTEAVARFRDQYQGKPNLNGLASIVAARAQLIENALYSLLVNRALRNATGILLDRIGGIVGLARSAVPNGGTDAVYAAWLGAQIRLNQSSGTAADIIAIMLAIADAGATVAVVDQYPASVAVRVFGVPLTQPTALQGVLQLAKAAGVRAILEYLGSTPATTFTLDGTAAQALDNGHFAGAI